MKKIVTYVVNGALILSLLLSFSVCAFAEDSTIIYRGQDEGFGFTPGSEYTLSDLFADAKGLMPGDTVSETLSFKNTASDCDAVVLYMKVREHSESNPLSEGVAEYTTLEENDSFLSQIDMVVTAGDSEPVYAGKANGSGSYVKIGTFSQGEGTEFHVDLTVPVTAGNEVAGRIGEIDLVFLAEAFTYTQLTVNKVWSDGAAAHAADETEVQLLRTKGSDTQPEETVRLNASNNWTYTFHGLDKDYAWSVQEINIPDGYKATYSTVGNQVTITNRNEETGGSALDISVTKQWSTGGHAQASYVTVGLYDGTQLMEVQRLDASNNWSYHWSDPERYGNWSVKETNIPSNYYPTYVTSGNAVVITNTYQLVQTGQLHWHIAVLAILGAALIAGGIVISGRKKHEA